MTFSTNDFFCINFLFYWCHWLCYFIDMFALCLFRFILLLVIVFAVTILSNTKRVCVRVRWVLPSNPLALLFFFYFCFLVITFHLGVKMYVIQSISAMQHALMIRLWKLSSWRAKPVVFSPFLSFFRSFVVVRQEDNELYKFHTIYCCLSALQHRISAYESDKIA